MDLAIAWQWFISLGVFTALGVSLVNAYSRWKTSEANEPHEYAKSYQAMQQTINGLVKSLKEEQQARRRDSKRLKDTISELECKMASVQEDAAIYAQALQDLETQHEILKKEHADLKKKYDKLVKESKR